MLNTNMQIGGQTGEHQIIISDVLVINALHLTLNSALVCSIHLPAFPVVQF